MQIWNSSADRSTQRIGEDLDLDFPLVVSGAIPVAQQVLDVVDVLLVWEVLTHRIADVGCAIPAGEHQRSDDGLKRTADADVANLNAIPVTREFRALRLDPAAEWAGPTESVGEEVIPGEARRGYGEACRPVNLARRNTAENADLGIQGIAGISGRNLHVSVDQVSPRVQHIRVRYGRWNSPGKHGPDARDLWHFATGVT